MPPVGLTSVLEETPSISPSGVSSAWCCWKPMTSASSARLWSGLRNWQSSPMRTPGTTALSRVPVTWVTRPRIWIGRQPSMAWRIRTMRGERGAGMAGRFGWSRRAL
ncbi:Uncharacterised protein [Acinetobacter baumannii]|nr:Uncharacterised protein [Acinetobacter baumannii]